MKKFEHKSSNLLEASQENTNSTASNLLSLLPSVIKLFPKLGLNNILGGQKTPQQNPTPAPTYTQTIKYPTAPSENDLRQSQIKNTLGVMQAHNYMVKSLRNGTTNEHSPQCQPVGTLPSTPDHQCCPDVKVTTGSIPLNHLEEV